MGQSYGSARKQGEVPDPYLALRPVGSRACVIENGSQRTTIEGCACHASDAKIARSSWRRLLERVQRHYIVSPQIGAVGGSSISVTPPTTATYTLYATNAFGQTTSTVTVTVH